MSRTARIFQALSERFDAPPKTPDEQELETAIGAMSDYLRCASLTSNREAIKAELIGLIRQHKVSGTTAFRAVKSGEPEVVRALGASGYKFDDMRDPEHRLRPSPHPLAVIDLPEMEPDRRLSFFEAVAEYVPSTEHGINLATRAGLMCADMDLLRAIQSWSPSADFEDLILRSIWIEEHAAKNLDFALDVLGQCRVDHPAFTRLAIHSLSQVNGRPRCLAVLLARGVRLGPVLQSMAPRDEDWQNSAPEWLKRLHARISSSHGEIELYRKPLTLTEALTLETKYVEVFLGGLSNRQKKKLAKLDRFRKPPKSLLALKEMSNSAE